EIRVTADDQTRFAAECAYGTSFPDPDKDNRTAGWYFSSERAFDITVAYQLDARPEYLEAIVGNVNYEVQPVERRLHHRPGRPAPARDCQSVRRERPARPPAVGLAAGQCPGRLSVSQQLLE